MTKFLIVYNYGSKVGNLIVTSKVNKLTESDLDLIRTKVKEEKLINTEVIILNIVELDNE